MEYHGEERRKMSQFDPEIYQKIIETHTNVANLVKNFDAHVSDDKKYWDKIDTINIKIATWTGIGTAAGFVISKIF